MKFKNINTGEELSFPSVKDAQLHFNEPNHISFTRRCQHIIKSPYNGEWRVAYAEDDYDGDRITLMKKSVSVGPRKILVEDLDTHSNAVYSSYRDFERKNNLKYKSVAVKTTYHKGDTFLFRKRYQITLLN